MSVEGSAGQVSRDVGSAHWYVSSACDGLCERVQYTILLVRENGRVQSLVGQGRRHSSEGEKKKLGLPNIEYQNQADTARVYVRYI